MATFVLKDAHLTIDSVDVSDHIVSITTTLEQAAVPDTNMGDDSDEFLTGLKNGNFTVNFSQDFAASEVDATLWSIYDGDAAVAFVIKPTSDAVAATNPSYTGNCILTSYSPIDGSVGDKAGAPVSFQVTGDVTRNTS